MTERRIDSRGPLAVALAIAAMIAIAAYALALSNPFVYDDEHILLHNEFIREARHIPRFFDYQISSTGYLNGAFRPLPMMTFYLNFAAGGLDPVGFRVTNLALLLVCGLALFAVTRRMLRAFPLGRLAALSEPEIAVASLLAAALFVLHPIESLTVLLAWKRTTLFGTLFFLVGVWLFMKWRGLGGRGVATRAGRAVVIAALAVTFGFAIGSKETAFTLPLVLGLIEVVRLVVLGGSIVIGRRFLVAMAAALGAFAVVAIVYPHVFRSALSAEGIRYLAGQLGVIVNYVAMIVSPGRIAAAYDASAGWGESAMTPWVAGAAIACIIAASAARVRRAPFVALVLLWFAITLAPTSSLLPQSIPVDEDRAVLPLALFWGLAGAGIVFAFRMRRVVVRVGVVAIAVAAILGSALATAKRGAIWSREEWLWLDAIEKYPNSDRAHTNLCANLASAADRISKAVPVCRRALELSPGNDIARAALVRAYVSLGAADEALREAERGLRELPNNPNIIRVAGIAAWMNSDKVRAQALFRRGVEMSPWDLESIVYLARTEVALGNKDAARETLRKLQGRVLADVALRLVLAEVELDLGDVARAEAIFAAERARIGSQMVEPSIGLAKAALIRGERARAGEILREAEREHADRPMALLKIARAFEAVQLFADAVRVIEGVVAARPAAVFPRTELARAYANAGRSAEACRAFAEVRERVKRDRAHERFLAQMDVLCGRSTTNGAPLRVNP